MSMTPRIHDARNAFAISLNAARATIDDGLSRIAGTPVKINVLPYYTANLNQNDLPVLMVEQTGVERDWESLDTGAGPSYKIRFNMTVWGLVVGFPDNILEDMASELEGSLAEYLNRRHKQFSSGGWTWYFNEILPLQTSSFGVTKLSMGIARGFTSSLRVDTIVTAPAPNIQ